METYCKNTKYSVNFGPGVSILGIRMITGFLLSQTNIGLFFTLIELLLSMRNDRISHIGHLGGLATGVVYFAYTRGPSFIKEAISVR